MKIAWIIQCHKNAVQVNTLIDLLRSDGDDVYVHCDAKSKSLRGELITGDNIYLLDESESVDVRWGFFSQCEATLALLKKVSSSGREYGYVALISGQCLPVKPIAEFKRMLEETSGEFIDVIDKEKAYRMGFNKRNDVRYYPFMIKNTTVSKLMKKAWKILTGGDIRTFGVFKKEIGIDTYYGSSWWVLSHKCIKEMLAFIEAHNELFGYYKTSLCSDESFFQTVFMTTSFAGNNKGMLWYVDWNNCGNNPNVLREGDYQRIISSGKYFARKIDFDTDKKIADMIIGNIT